MLNETVVEFFDALAQLVQDRVTDMQLVEQDGDYTLLFTAPAPFFEGSEMAYAVTMLSNDENLVEFRIILQLFVNVPPESFSDVMRLITAINACVVLGGFSLREEEGMIHFTHGILLDTSVSVEAAAKNLLHTMVLMEQAAVRGGGMLLELLGGDASLEVLLNQLQEG